MSIVLAVDAGQTASRLKLVVDGASVHEWSGPAYTAGGEPHAVLSAMMSDTAATLESRGLPPPTVLSAGMTGFHGAVTGASELLESYRPLGVGRVVLATDAVTSYLGAVGVVPGVVVAAGTGTIVLANDVAGRCARIDGWGSTLGDAGSGYSIGRAGLRAAYLSLDGKGGSERLREAAEDRYGDLQALPGRLARGADAVAVVAGFAKDVASVACAGDPVATTIWRRAGEDLADSVAAGAARVFGTSTRRRPRSISWAGALFRAGPLLIEPFQARLAANGLPSAQPPEANGLEGALLLASEGVAALFPTAAATASVAC